MAQWNGYYINGLGLFLSLFHLSYTTPEFLHKFRDECEIQKSGRELDLNLNKFKKLTSSIFTFNFKAASSAPLVLAGLLLQRPPYWT